MISKDIQKSREMFMAIAVIEHHISALSRFSTYELSNIFAKVWESVVKQVEFNNITLEKSSVMKIHSELSKSLDVEVGEFQNEEKWKILLDSCGEAIEEDPAHVISWIFSSLYWDHLAQLKLVTAWFYTNALRIQQGLPVFRLSVNKIGEFMDSLSGSGPPIYDGQTFYPEDYS